MSGSSTARLRSTRAARWAKTSRTSCKRSLESAATSLPRLTPPARLQTLQPAPRLSFAPHRTPRLTAMLRIPPSNPQRRRKRTSCKRSSVAAKTSSNSSHSRRLRRNNYFGSATRLFAISATQRSSPAFWTSDQNCPQRTISFRPTGAAPSPTHGWHSGHQYVDRA